MPLGKFKPFSLEENIAHYDLSYVAHGLMGKTQTWIQMVEKAWTNGCQTSSNEISQLYLAKKAIDWHEKMSTVGASEFKLFGGDFKEESAIMYLT